MDIPFGREGKENSIKGKDDIGGIMDYLYTDRIVATKDSKTEKYFLRLERKYKSNRDIPSQYVSKLWEKYQKVKPKKNNNSLNGNIFEAIIKTCLYKEGIKPFFPQARLQFVPNIDYDIIIFPKDSNGAVDISAPMCLSLKTSLRERYKQADLEGKALKEVYKRAKSYLITIDKTSEIDKIANKILQKDVLGIDEVIDARSNRFDELVKYLKLYGVNTPPPIDAMVSNLIVQ